MNVPSPERSDATAATGRTLQLRSRALDWRPVEGEIVALDLERSQYLAANLAGALLWEALAQGITEAALVEQLAQRYGLAQAVAAADVAAFLAALAAQSLLEP